MKVRFVILDSLSMMIYEVFREIITSYHWDFCQIQLNYMDKDTQATLKGVELAESLGIPMVLGNL